MHRYLVFLTNTGTLDSPRTKKGDTNVLERYPRLGKISIMRSYELLQVQAVYMYGAAQPDFLKSETNGGIKNIISHHLKIIKRCVFSPNLEGVAQKISLPRPWEV